MAYQEQLYLKCNGRYVYLHCYMCEKQANALIIFPGVGWYHVGPNRIYVYLAEMCNQAGINVYCFDYMGYGESWGDYKVIGWRDLKESCQMVYTYVRNRTPGNLFAMGYGLGNALLRTLYDRNDFQGKIYYLPIYYGKEKLQALISELFMQNSEELCVKVDLKQTKWFALYELLFGEFHDCTYNPVTKKLITEVIDNAILENERESEDNNLIIADKKIEGWGDQFIVPEFCLNKVPEDWYRTPNLWPSILKKVNSQIVEWLKRKVDYGCRYTHTEKKIETVQAFSSINDELSIRKTIQVKSDGNILAGILHYPKVANENYPCAIFIPGLGGDKSDNFSNGPRLGKVLSDNGIALFRYDDRYSGANNGHLVDYKLSDVIRDFYNVYNYLLSLEFSIDRNNIFVIAWSAGAQVANHVIAEGKVRIRGCCYWNPVFINGAHTIKMNRSVGNNTKYTKNSLGQYVCQIGGEYLGIEYAKDKQKFNFVKDFQRNKSEKMFIWSNCETSSLEYEYVISEEQESPSKVIIVDSANHLFTYDLLGDIQKNTLAWIKECNGQSGSEN